MLLEYGAGGCSNIYIYMYIYIYIWCNVVVPFTNILKLWPALLQCCTALDNKCQCCTAFNIAQLCYNLTERCIMFGNVPTTLDSVWQRCTTWNVAWLWYNNAQRCTTLKARIIDLSHDPIWAIWLAEVSKFYQHHDRIMDIHQSNYGYPKIELWISINRMIDIHKSNYGYP